MANASLMAGIAFSNSMVGLAHAIAHSLGAVCHIPHGDAVAIILPYAMEYNLNKLKNEYAELLECIVHEDEYINITKEKRAERTIEEIKKMILKLNCIAGLPAKLQDVGISKNDFEKVAQTAINDGAIIVNPREVEKQDIIKILEKAY